MTSSPAQLDLSDHTAQPVIDMRQVSRYFFVRQGFLRPPARIHAVDMVDLRVFPHETVGLVGESGSGKSTLGRIAVGLLPPSAGVALLNGQDAALSLRAKKYPVKTAAPADTTDISAPPPAQSANAAQMVFQDPFSSLNPRLPVGISIAEPLTCMGIPRAQRQRYVAEILERVGLLPEHAKRYPHQFSGGQRQRVAIARAVIGKPALLVCDEPVSSLDTSVQAQMLNLFKQLQSDFRLSYLFISHDLHVVGYMCDRIAVMYLGRIVECAPRATLLAAPAHPYTQALLAAAPALSPEQRAQSPALGGEMPSPITPPAGCAFHPRCPHAFERCRRERPAETILHDAPTGTPAKHADSTGHRVCCHLHTA